jgi:hypothetical protein
MPQRRVLHIHRQIVRHDGSDRTLSFFARPGRRKGGWVWFEPDEVPEFNGDEADFECERVKGGWKVLRQVHAQPSGDSERR